jgi:hypothetical protein
MVPLLVVVQALAAILLGAVGLFPSLQKAGGGLNRNGYVFLAVGAFAFVVATATIQILNDAESDRKQQRIEDLMNVIADRVMASPGGPAAPIEARVGDVIKIESPPDGAEVDQQAMIEGSAVEDARNVWLVVHPVDTSSYWVQPRVAMRSNGTWSGMVYLGRSGERDKGKNFEIVAIADPEGTLREGEYGSSWPKAKWASRPVVLTRR